MSNNDENQDTDYDDTYDQDDTAPGQGHTGALDRQPAEGEGRIATIQEDPSLKSDIMLDRSLFLSLHDGDQIKANRFMAEAYAAIRRNPKLLAADRRSLILALGEVAVQGLSLSPQLGECYLIPEYDKNYMSQMVEFRTGYRGLLKLIYRSGAVDWTSAHVVRTGEHFREVGGTDPRIEHEIPLTGVNNTDDGIVGAYFVLQLKGSTRPISYVVNREDIEKAARMSGRRKDSNWSDVWKMHFKGMALKTAIRRAAKYIPGADELRAVLAREDARDAGNEPPVLEQLRGIAHDPRSQVGKGNNGRSSLDSLIDRAR